MFRCFDSFVRGVYFWCMFLVLLLFLVYVAFGFRISGVLLLFRLSVSVVRGLCRLSNGSGVWCWRRCLVSVFVFVLVRLVYVPGVC